MSLTLVTIISELLTPQLLEVEQLGQVLVDVAAGLAGRIGQWSGEAFDDYIEALVAIIRAGFRAKAEEVARKSLVYIGTEEDPAERDERLYNATLRLAKIGLTGLAREAARAIDWIEYKEEALAYAAEMDDRHKAAPDLEEDVVPAPAVSTPPVERSPDAAFVPDGDPLARLRPILTGGEPPDLDYLFELLADQAQALAAVDHGHTLWQLFQAILEVDGWWEAAG
jgi:hypothetical protein